MFVDGVSQRWGSKTPRKFTSLGSGSPFVVLCKRRPTQTEDQPQAATRRLCPLRADQLPRDGGRSLLAAAPEHICWIRAGASGGGLGHRRRDGVVHPCSKLHEEALRRQEPAEANDVGPLGALEESLGGVPSSRCARKHSPPAGGPPLPLPGCARIPHGDSAGRVPSWSAPPGGIDDSSGCGAHSLRSRNALERGTVEHAACCAPG